MEERVEKEREEGFSTIYINVSYELADHIENKLKTLHIDF